MAKISARGWRIIAVVAVVILVALLFVGLGGLRLLSLQQAPPAPKAAGLWSVAWEAADPVDFGGATTTNIISADGHTMDVYAGVEAFEDSTAIVTSEFSVINLNAGSSTDLYQLTAQPPTAQTISSPSTGAAYPMILPDESNPNLPDNDYSAESAHGSQVQGVFYLSFAPGGTDVVVSVCDFNTAAAMYEAMTVGSTYTASFVVGGISMNLVLHPTAVDTD